MRGKCIWSFLLLLLLSFNGLTESLKILGLFPHPALSHFKFFHPVMRRLAETGHSVSVVSHFEDAQPPPGYKDFLLPGANFSDAIDINMFDAMPMQFMLHYGVFYYLHSFGLEACNSTLYSEAIAQILEEPVGAYDVILMEHFNTDCMMGVAHKLQAPVVALSSCALMPWHYERMGMPIIPSYISASLLGQSQEMSFGGRLANWISTHTINWLYKLITMPATDALLRNRFGPSMPSTSQLVKTTSLMLINQHFSMSGPKPLPPNVVEVGGLHISEAKPLSEELQQLLDNAKHGVILISWGSQIKASSLSDVKRDGLLRALARFKQQIIWKWENDTLPNRPDNVYIMKWLPQRDILSHPNVKVFFSHGGLMGITEAVSSAVPLVAMPIYGDQFVNVAALVQRGMAVQLDFSSFSEETVFDALTKALDGTYKQNAQRVALTYNERLQTPLDTATWWVEHVAETGGAPLLQPSAVHLSRFVYYSLDVYVVIGSALLLLLVLGKLIWRLCRRKKQKVTAPKLKHKRN